MCIEPDAITQSALLGTFCKTGLKHQSQSGAHCKNAFPCGLANTSNAVHMCVAVAQQWAAARACRQRLRSLTTPTPYAPSHHALRHAAWLREHQ